jgi:energy-coupling factor transporter transmembrane protein EcfT
MKRSPFPATPFPRIIGALEHPLPLMAAFLLLALAVGISWTWDRLTLSAIGVLFFLLLPRPSARPFLLLARFTPLLILVMLIHAFPWRGFEGGIPWRYDAGGWLRGLLALSRFAFWILLSARALESLHPAALMSRLPSNPRLARWALVPVMAFSFLDFFLREAFLLEKAWRARGGASGRSSKRAHWPALLLPLFRGMLARGETLAEALAVRRFPERWAGGAKLPWRGASLARLAAAAIVLILVWSRRQVGA